MSDFLFEAFDEISAKQWKQQIQYDLKGLDYNQTLVWQSAEGINVRPFYHADDFSRKFQPIPGQPESWKIAQGVFIGDQAKANGIAVDGLRRGAQAIVFSADGEFEIQSVFKNYLFKNASIHFNFNFLSEKFLKELINFLSEKNGTVFYNVDIIGKLARSGNWFQNEKQDFEILDNIISENPSQNILAVDASGYQNAGANMVQQLAYALAHANEYLNRFGHNIEKLSFKLATGPNYFFEIAKIRALRKLYAVLAMEYRLNETCHILSIPTKRNKTLYDYNVNLLRSTTECMSAVLGGANVIYNLPYDALYHKSNEFGERIARNQLLILKHESYLDAVSNPSDGAYYIERLTDELAEKALQLFKEIEKSGGFLYQLKEGTIQKKIKESAETEQQLFDSGKLKLLGTNYHPNPKDSMKDELELFPFVKKNPVKTLIVPIIEKRLSETMEQERLVKES